MPIEPAVALSSEAIPKIVRLASNSGRRPNRSPIGPAESAPTRMPMLDHRNAVGEHRWRQVPGLDQRRHRPGDRIEVVAVADLHQRAQCHDTKLQPADPLVLERGLGRRHRRLRHFGLLTLVSLELVLHARAACKRPLHRPRSVRCPAIASHRDRLARGLPCGTDTVRPISSRRFAGTAPAALPVRRPGWRSDRQAKSRRPRGNGQETHHDQQDRPVHGRRHGGHQGRLHRADRRLRRRRPAERADRRADRAGRHRPHRRRQQRRRRPCRAWRG